MRNLIPGATVSLLPKRQLPHNRQLQIALTDGRT